MPRRPDHNAHVPGPYHQVAGLRPRGPLKTFDPSIDVCGTRVSVREAGLFVDRVNQMRAIARRTLPPFGIKRCGDHGQSIVGGQRSIDPTCVIRLRAMRLDTCGVGLSRLPLASRDTRSNRTSQNGRHRLQPNPHRLYFDALPACRGGYGRAGRTCPAVFLWNRFNIDIVKLP